MGKKGRTWHCGHCGSPCYLTKGKGKHRFLICPRHGVIANNPLPLLAAAVPLAMKYGGQAVKSLSGRSRGGEAAQEISRSGGSAPVIYRDIVKTELVDID